LGSVEAIAGLLKALEDPDSYVRRGAIEALGKLGSVEAIAGLLKALEDPNSDVRRGAIEALGKLGSVEAIAGLLKALEHPDSYVRRRATKLLGQVGGEKAVTALITALRTRGVGLRVIVAEELGRIASEDESITLSKALIVMALMNALHDKYPLVRQESVEALGKIGTPKPLSELWRQQLSSSNTDIYQAISAIQSRCKFYNYEIFQSRLEEEKAEISPSGGTTINIGSVGNLNTGDVTVQGHQIGTQNNPAAEPTE